MLYTRHTRIIGEIIGSVILQKVSNALQPSSCATSYSVGEIACKPDRKIKICTPDVVTTSKMFEIYEVRSVVICSGIPLLTTSSVSQSKSTTDSEACAVRETSESSIVVIPVARIIGIEKIARKNPLPLNWPFNRIAINSDTKI